MKKLSFLLMAMLLSVMSNAQTVLFTQTYPGSPSTYTNAYTSSFTVTTGDYTLTYAKINNGQSGQNWTAIRSGQKSSDSKATITTEQIAKPISKVVINFTEVNASKTKALYLEVSASPAFDNATQIGATIAKGEVEFAISAPAGSQYYRIVIDQIKHGSSNGFNRWDKVIFYEGEAVEEDPDAVKYTITTAVNDEKMGTVSGAGEYTEGSDAYLTATPKAGYQFVNWSNGSTDNPLKITVTEDIEITANFEAIPPMTCAEAAAAPSGATVVLNPFDVVAVVKGAGYIYIKDESGVNLIYDFNLDDQLKAGDHVEGFVGYSSPYNGLPELKTSVAYADLTVTPGTAPEPTIMAAAPTKAELNQYVKFENVTLTANTTFSTGRATNATMVVNGTNVTLRNAFKLAATLSADKAYNIVGFVAIYNSTIQVYFLSVEEYVDHTITVSANPTEAGTVTGGGEFEETDEITVKAVANDGYDFVNWTENDVEVSTEANYSFTVLADRNLVANFKKSVVTHDFYAEGVTVSEGGWSINLSGSWNEQSFTVMLWQDNTQGFGTYAADAETGYTATLGVKELTPTAPGYYTDMQDGTFTFQGTMTDGTDIYEVFLKGALASESETGEMEAKTEVAFSCDADGVWGIEAFADDYSWGLMLEVVPNLETGEYVATGYYVTDIAAGVMEEVAGTGMLYFDDFSGCQVFKGNLTTESGNIYPTLYASSLALITNEIKTGPSWIGEIAGVDYYEVLLMANNYLWELDLHARNCTGDPGTYTVDIVDVEEGAYSTFMGTSAVTGELTIYEDNSYEAYVTTVDADGNSAMLISLSAWKAEATEYDVVITDATVTDNTSGYNIDLTGKWEGHDIKVEVCDELTAETILANFFFDGGIANDGDQAEGEVTATVSEGVVTITGTFESGSGNVYNVTISGTLPVGPTVGLENLDTTVAPAKAIVNGQLVIIKNGVKYNAQGAVVK